jgi:threonine dehydratase
LKLRETPLIRCQALEAELGGQVYLKLESLQITGSFKLRGAMRAVASLDDVQREAGVVTASAGNHGAGLARAAGLAGVTAIVVVPERTPENKRNRMRSLGADLRVEGQDYDASEVIARQLAKDSGATFVSAFDDDEVLAGNGGSLGAEIRRQCPEVARVVVPVGGGGLIAGMANELVPKGVEVVGAQPINNCAMRDSLAVGHALCEYEKESTVAEGCEGAVCERTYAIVARHGLDIGTTSEEAILDAVAFLYRECGVVAETSAAVPVAAVREKEISLADSGATVIVISGGNIDQDALDEILESRV